MGGLLISMRQVASIFLFVALLGVVLIRPSAAWTFCSFESTWCETPCHDCCDEEPEEPCCLEIDTDWNVVSSSDQVVVPVCVPVELPPLFTETADPLAFLDTTDAAEFLEPSSSNCVSAVLSRLCVRLV